jgi:hypothetical protein
MTRHSVARSLPRGKFRSQILAARIVIWQAAVLATAAVATTAVATIRVC